MKTAMLLCILFMLGSWLLALTGYGTSAPVINDTVDPTLSITAPNGGEAWYIGDTNDIIWSASDTNLSPNSVYLWFSMNGGTTYSSLAEAIANGGSYPWEMPTTESYNAKVRIKVYDNFGSFSQIASASPFAITYVPPQMPTGITVDTSNNVDAVLSWNAVTQTIFNTPITPDGYIVLYNETPYEDDQFYYFLTETANLSYTHLRVARFRSQMYYRIVAYKDFDGRIAGVLANVKANPETKYCLKEIKQDLVSASFGGDK